MISLPNIIKWFMNHEAKPYDLPDAEDIVFDNEILAEEMENSPAIPEDNDNLAFADVQAEAILQQAKQEAGDLLAKTKDSIQSELDMLRQQAQQEGFQAGYIQGTEAAIRDTEEQINHQTEEMGREVKNFLEKATEKMELMLEETKEDMRDLSLAVAEKIVRVSLKSSGDVVSRMICNATEKMKRKEWVHIYVAGTDTKQIAKVMPSLTVTLASLSDNVKIVPMSESKTGTCIIEMPDEIVDASVSTQFENISKMCNELQH